MTSDKCRRLNPANSGFLDDKLSEALLTKRVLVVGSGGIGCELLKNLALTGFRNIDVIDLDTIDVSNLNRQFLFQKKHVGMSKCEVARESVLQYNPDVAINAFHGNVKGDKFNVDYFKQFALVLGALDNIGARNHVNRMCLAANVPLIESGTAGYLGQVTVIIKGMSECFECHPKPAPKQYPVCTIRNTPSQPIHCIVWGKFLFNQLWGVADDENNISPDTEDPEAGLENKNESATLESGVNTEGKDQQGETSGPPSLRDWAALVEEEGKLPFMLLQKLFSDDVKVLQSMDKLWKERTRPKTIGDVLLKSLSENPEQFLKAKGEGFDEQRVWDLAECCAVFIESAAKLISQSKAAKEAAEEGDDGSLVWDKDDETAMDFVTAAANIRCFNFSIPNKSRFDVKSMAGNIIPAIATTNAIIAGMIVVEALKIMAGEPERCINTYLSRKPNSQEKLLITTGLEAPNPKCYVCAAKPEVFVKVNTSTMTIADFTCKILKGALSMSLPDVMEQSRIIISSEEGETDMNNDKCLSDMQIRNGTILSAEDFSQHYEVLIHISHCEVFDEGVDFLLAGDMEALKESKKPEEKQSSPVKLSAGSTVAVIADDDDLVVIEEPLETSNGSSLKRVAESEPSPALKKIRLGPA
eukprot:Nk52_evm7s1779 gene=Nk52_evmTU7s1779